MYSLITGATSGIGKEFAVKLAEAGCNLILTGRREKELNGLKEQLEKKYKIKVELILGDFSEKNVLENIFSTVKEKKIKFLINNVGYGNKNSFFQGKIEESLKMIDIHIGITVELCHQIIPFMEENSYVINVSSLAAFFPTPYNHIYCATKSFLISFSESLAFSLEDKKIKVKVLLPGFTYTDFHRDMEIKKNIFWMTAEKVVSCAMKDLNKGNVLIIPGFFNRCFYLIAKVVPKKILYLFLKKQKKL